MAGSYTKWAVFVYERPVLMGSYTKQAVFVYEGGFGEGPDFY